MYNASMEKVQKYMTPEEVEKLYKKGVDFVVDSQGSAIETDSNPDPKVRENNRKHSSFRRILGKSDTRRD